MLSLQLSASVGVHKSVTCCSCAGDFVLDFLNISLHLTTFCDCHRHSGLVPWVNGHILHLPDNEHSVPQDPSNHYVLVVKPVCLGTGDEELASVCARSTICLDATQPSQCKSFS